MPLGPEEAFIFSRVDGRATDAEIAAATGLSSFVVATSLERLEALGAIRFDGTGQDGPAAQAPASPADAPPTEPATSTADDETDLDSERRALILSTFSRLAQLNHYELLGIDPTADRKTIKETYYKVASVLHPDRYYGKKLGSFKAKIEAIFERFTEAERTLSDPSARTEYDSYLARQQRTRDVEQALGASREATFVLQSAPPVQATPAEPNPSDSSLPPMSVPNTLSQPSPRFSLPPSEEQRKRALARKLLGGGPPSARRPQPIAAVQPSDRAPGSCADDLRRLYEQQSQASRGAKLEGHLRAAEAALVAKKPVQAADELRAAEALSPSDPKLLGRIQSVRLRLAEDMADSYLEQGRYEEQAGRLADAAASYQKAAAGKPSAVSCTAAARCLLESSGDLRRAAELARKAAVFAPRDAQTRLILARVFLAAGMRTSALNTLEQASGLAPDDANIRNWLRRLRRGDA